MRNDRILRKRELQEKVGLSDTTVWRLEQAGDFPRRLRLGGLACGWLESEVNEWLGRKAAKRK